MCYHNVQNKIRILLLNKNSNWYLNLKVYLQQMRASQWLCWCVPLSSSSLPVAIHEVTLHSSEHSTLSASQVVSCWRCVCLQIMRQPRSIQANIFPYKQIDWSYKMNSQLFLAVVFFCFLGCAFLPKGKLFSAWMKLCHNSGVVINVFITFLIYFSVSHRVLPVRQ